MEVFAAQGAELSLVLTLCFSLARLQRLSCLKRERESSWRPPPDVPSFGA